MFPCYFPAIHLGCWVSDISFAYGALSVVLLGHMTSRDTGTAASGFAELDGELPGGLFSFLTVRNKGSNQRRLSARVCVVAGATVATSALFVDMDVVEVEGSVPKLRCLRTLLGHQVSFVTREAELELAFSEGNIKGRGHCFLEQAIL